MVLSGLQDFRICAGPQPRPRQTVCEVAQRRGLPSRSCYACADHVCLGLQAVMLDIVVMLFVILQPYFPAEVRWSPFMNFYDILSFNTCMPAIIYCIFWALW